MNATAVKRGPKKSGELTEARRKARQLGRLRAELTAQIEAERLAGPPDRAVIEDEIRRAEAEVARLDSLLERARAHAKNRKREIDDWKLWYQGHSSIDKAAQRQQLDAEIAWRAQDIAAREQEIQALLTQQVEARGAYEAAKTRLAAFDAGAHLLPVDQDPRLLALGAACANARLAVSALAPRSGRSARASGAGKTTANTTRKPAKGARR